MQGTLLLSCVSLVLALSLTPLIRRVSSAMGLVDAPDGRRKLHSSPVPRTGGVAVAMSYALSFTIVWMLGVASFPDSPIVVMVGAPAILMFLVGLCDDLFSLASIQKLAGQVAAASLAYALGLRIDVVAGFEIGQAAGLVLTLLWLVGCSNAFNLIDGVDGLAAGVGLVATLTTFTAALMQGNRELTLMTLPLAGALLGFLRFNFNPASIFLGDSGSLLIGFLLAAYGIIWSQKSATLLGLTAPVMALALPLLDVGLSVIRRFLRRRPIFAADRGHIHHRLLDAGFTERKTALVLYGCCAAGAALSLVHTIFQGRTAGLLVTLFCLLSVLAIRRLQYDEFSALCAVLRRDVLRSALATQVSLAKLEREVRRASGIEECLAIFEEGAAELGFTRSTPAATRDDEHDRTSLRVELELPGYGKWVLNRDRSGNWPVTGAIEALNSLHLALSERAEQLLRPPIQDAGAATTASLLALLQHTGESSCRQEYARTWVAGNDR